MSPRSRLEEGFQRFVRKHRLVHPGDSVLLAVSGGIDSMVLLSLFHAFRKPWNLSLGVVHVNHLLRGEESSADEAFVRDSASALKLPCFTKQFDTIQYAREHHCAWQEAAREIRYSFFEATRLSAKAASVATAHQANDNAETVLMNAIRGAGIRGLSGIPLRRDPGGIIRPLLFAYRAEIEDYALERGVRHREDSSNFSLKYLRNAVRQRIIPELQQESHSDVLASLNRVSDIMRSLGSRIEREITIKEKKLLANGPTGSPEIILSLFHREPFYLQEEFILHMLRKLGIEPTAEKVVKTVELTSLQTGRSLELSAEITAYRERDRLVFSKPATFDPFTVRVKVGGSYKVRNFHFSLKRARRVPRTFGKERSTEFVDADHLGSKLVLRSWKAGDRFVALGMRRATKLSDFFTDQKVPRFEKSQAPILESDGEIVWVCGRRLDDRFKVTRTTRAAVKMTFQPLREQ